MSKFTYVDDAIVDFFHNLEKLPVTHPDESAITSFAVIVLSDKEFTENQANYSLKILKKYKILAKQIGIDYEDILNNPVWKKPFRTIDYSREVFVEKDDDRIWICLKFPYQLKKTFDNEIADKISYTMWDAERRIRKIDLYQANLIQLYDFCQTHKFVIDEKFMIMLGEVEEIWQNQEQIIPHLIIENDAVRLINATDSASEYFEKNQCHNIVDDLLLGKKMGFTFIGKPNSMIEKIASTEQNNFYTPSIEKFLQLSLAVSGKICMILDRSDNLLNWLTNFLETSDSLSIDRNIIKFCHRAEKNENAGLNEFIKENGLGGSVSDGKIFIFVHKPAKWLFKILDDVSIIASTNLYPTTNGVTKVLLDSHPCVVHVGEFKPSELRETKIVQL
jgi:hypothetical protein